MFNPRNYPKSWPALRAAVQARAGDRCEQCGVANHAVGARDLGGQWHDERAINGMNSTEGFMLFGAGSWCKMIRIVCTTAHKPGTSKMSENIDDLLFLCQRDHLALDRPHHLAVQKANRDRRRGQVLLPGMEVTS